MQNKFILSCLSLAAIVNGCGPKGLNSQSLTTDEQFDAVTAELENELGLRAEKTIGSVSVAELNALNLPKGNWANYKELLSEIHHTGDLKAGSELSHYESGHCPNFDVDGNGKIELIRIKNPDGSETLKGDLAILQHAMLGWSVGLGWTKVKSEMAADNSLRMRRLGEGIMHDYLNCLSGRWNGGPDRLDIDGDGRYSVMDVVLLRRAIDLKLLPSSLGSSAKQVAASERLHRDVKVCYAHFKFNQESTARSYQVSCGLEGFNVHRQLPDLTAQKIINGNKVICSYKVGNVEVFSKTLQNAVSVDGPGQVLAKDRNCGG